MTWDEQWLSEDHPEYDEIPDEYSIWPRGGRKIVAVYFVGLYVVFYLFLELFGKQAILILGFPQTLWATALFVILICFGMYWFGWRPHSEVKPNRSAQETPTKTDGES